MYDANRQESRIDMKGDWWGVWDHWMESVDNHHRERGMGPRVDDPSLRDEPYMTVHLKIQALCMFIEIIIIIP